METDELIFYEPGVRGPSEDEKMSKKPDLVGKGREKKGCSCGTIISNVSVRPRKKVARPTSNVKLKEAICPVCKKAYKYPAGFEKQTCGRFECVYKMAVKKLKIRRVQQ